MTLSRAQAQVSTHHGYVVLFFFEVLGCQGTSFHLIAGSNSQWISLQRLNLYITEYNNEIFYILAVL